MKEIDAKGLACPAPVLLTKNAIEEDFTDEIKVLVDTEVSAENVSRFLSSSHFTVSRKDEGGNFIIIGKRHEGGIPKSRQTPQTCPASSSARKAEEKKIMVMISSACMGHGDDVLGTKLVNNFIKTLKEMGNELWRLVFINSGVKLTIDGAETLSEIKELEKNNIKILVCGTCLDHFKLLEQKRVGETTNMLDIVTSMQLADQVINI